MSEDIENKQLEFPFYEAMAPKQTEEKADDFKNEDEALAVLLEGRDDDSGSFPVGDLATADPGMDPPIADVSAPGGSVFPLNTAEDGMDNTEPDSVEPESVEPDSVEPESVEPESVEPESVEPESVEPESVEPDSVEPESVEPESVEPESVEPVEIIIPDKKNKSLPPLSEITIRRAALGFLASLSPDGIGFKFALKARVHVDAGAFFFASGRKPEVARTILVETCVDREKCWIESSEKAALLDMLAAEKKNRAELEEKLKVKEPGLKDDSLFPEAQTWDFARTKNRAYHACLRRIEKLEYAVYHGSKFERLMFEQLANQYYLAVPSGLIKPEELPAEWGLIYIAPDDYHAVVIRPAKEHECPAENRTAFALRAAASLTADSLFANGISLDSSHIVRFHPLPKRRRAF